MLQFPNTATTGINCGTSSLFAAPAYTITGWIRRMGNGTTISTGTGGITAEPIFTGGLGESETLGLNFPWFIGYIPTSSSIAVDFEDSNTGANNPLTASINLVPNFSASHIAVTYNMSSSRDTGSLKIYINGLLNVTRSITSSNSRVRMVDTSSKQFAGIGCGIVSSGVKSGAWNGIITEVAMWNTELSASDISTLYRQRIKGAPLTLLAYSSSISGYWPLDQAGNNTTQSTAKGAIQDRSGRQRHAEAAGTIIGIAEDFLSYPS